MIHDPRAGDPAPPVSRESVARQIRQRLELNQLSGWSVPLRVSKLKSAAPPAPADRPGRTPREPILRVPTTRAPNPERSREPGPPLTEVSTVERNATASSAGAPVGAEAGANGEALERLRETVAECRACQLCDQRTQTVFGAGNPAARLMFVGEGPGADEDRAGEPFVGPAGQLLTRMIEAMGLRREDVYIANVVKCRPPDNRNPNPEEVAACSEYLRRQIAFIQPQVIVALGAVAAAAFLGEGASVGRSRNRFREVDGRAVLVTYHPAYLLRSPQEKRKVWDDLQLVLARLQLQVPDR